jgi:hypothetical protein
MLGFILFNPTYSAKPIIAIITKNYTIPMNDKLQTEKDNLQENTNVEISQEIKPEKVLCPHCQRTATNGIKCKGICVADNDY